MTWLHDIRIKLADALLDLALRVDPTPPPPAPDELPAVLRETVDAMRTEEQETARTLRHLADLVESGDVTSLSVSWDGPTARTDASLQWGPQVGQA